MVAGGDAKRIDRMLESELKQISADESGWLKLFQHRETGQYWELSWPQGEMHGGGPRLLRLLAIDSPNDWKP